MSTAACNNIWKVIGALRVNPKNVLHFRSRTLQCRCRTRTVAKNSSTGGLALVRGGFPFVQGALTLKIDKSSADIYFFKFQFGGDRNFVWGAMPTNPPPWWRDCAGPWKGKHMDCSIASHRTKVCLWVNKKQYFSHKSWLKTKTRHLYLKSIGSTK